VKSAGTPRLLARRAALLGSGLSCLLLAGTGWSDEKSTSGTPLDLLLTREELQAIANRYASIAPAGEEADELAQVTVRAPAELARMRDPSQDIMGGIAAPFWAIAHPKDAWRIFLPIPPKGEPVAPPIPPR
jgi:hypothetical protein